MPATWIFNRLAVSGDPDALHDFTSAAQGPGFTDWWPNFAGATDHLPESIAHPLRRRLQAIHDASARAALKDGRRCKLDFAALVPIPDDVRRSGYVPRGRAWCLEHWGVAHPPSRLECEARERRVYVETKHRGRGRLARLIVPEVLYSFTTRDGAPWPIVAAIKARWPVLDVRLAPLELDTLAGMLPVPALQPDIAARQAHRPETVNARAVVAAKPSEARTWVNSWAKALPRRQVIDKTRRTGRIGGGDDRPSD